MNSVDPDKARAPVVAPREPISPAPSASAAPTSAPAKPAASAPAATSESARAPLPSSASTATVARESARTGSPAPAAAASSSSVAANSRSASVVAPASTSTPAAAASLPGASATASAPVNPGRAPSPAQATRTASVPASSKETPNTPTESKSPKQLNGQKTPFGDVDADSELSEPASSVHSPSGVEFNELEDEIVVGERNGIRKLSPLHVVSDREDEVMADAEDEPVVSHYPKRKRTSLFNDLSESKIEIPKSAADDKPPPADLLKPKPARPSLSSVKGAILGYWRDSPAPDESSKHAVIGFIDVRDRLRTRIQAINTMGESVTNEYPLPPGPGGSWVTFERIVFSDHLVHLDHHQVKEYVRIRSDPPEETDEERKTAEKLAVDEAKRRARANPLLESNTNPPLIAYGRDMPEHAATPNRAEAAKRRRISGGFATINPAPANGVPNEQPIAPPHTLASQPARPPIDPLPGTRPTRILLGHWKGSSESSIKDRHAVYGILGQNDMFRVKLVRETRDGRFVDGNFPIGAGALWIQYEEVEFEDHLKPLARLEIKEYCRVRQWQLDHGESADERPANELKAVQEAQSRAGTNYKPNNTAPLIVPSYPPIAPEPAAEVINQAGRPGFGGHELRQSRRVEAKADGRPARQPLPNGEARPVVNRTQSDNAVERTNTLAQREIARAEAAQGRADRHAANRERAAAAAADATAAAAAAIPAVTTNGRMRFHESEEMQRLNKVWARQESLRVKAGAEDAKVYGGIKYERKGTGPFMGKLVSQGTIISIDGEDYVEYRVLTKPSFF